MNNIYKCKILKLEIFVKVVMNLVPHILSLSLDFTRCFEPSCLWR